MNVALDTNFAVPGDAGFPLNQAFEAPRDRNEAETLRQYMMQMRQELAQLGIEETKTSEAVKEAVENTKGTLLVVVNSVCGCAAGGARPGIAMALQNEATPDKAITVFAGSSTIPITNATDLVFDPTRNLLYITTRDGSIQRYSLATQSLLAPFTTDGLPDSADITPDGSTLYVAVKASDNEYYGYLLGLDSTTLATKYKVFLKDPRNNNANNAGILDIGTASPMVALSWPPRASSCAASSMRSEVSSCKGARSECRLNSRAKLARDRLQRRASVSTNRGFSAESPSASRKRFTAAFSPWSKSTNVSTGQSEARSVSRVTISPGLSSNIASI